MDCIYQQQHPRIDSQLNQHDARLVRIDMRVDNLAEVTSGIREELAEIKGHLNGALAASKTAGAVIGTLISLAVSSGIALLLFILRR